MMNEEYMTLGPYRQSVLILLSVYSTFDVSCIFGLSREEGLEDEEEIQVIIGFCKGCWSINSVLEFEIGKRKD